jgi:DNA-binding transcriptional LysR family regulator
MRFDILKIFLSVIEGGSISSAAKKHHLTQPAVSSQIRALEIELGKPVFNRSSGQKKSPILTKEGEMFSVFAKNILKSYDELSIAINGINGTCMSVTVGSSPTNGTYIFPYLIESFKRNFPSIDIDAKMKSGDSIHNDIINEVFDIAITTNSLLYREKILYEKLMSDPLVLVANSSFPIKKTITIDQLKSLPFVLRTSGATSKYILESNLKKHSCNLEDLNIILRVFDNESVKQAVKANLAVGFVTNSSVVSDLSNELKIIKIKNLFMERNLYLMRLRNSSHSFTIAMQSFWDFAIFKKWM